MARRENKKTWFAIEKNIAIHLIRGTARKQCSYVIHNGLLNRREVEQHPRCLCTFKEQTSNEGVGLLSLSVFWFDARCLVLDHPLDTAIGCWYRGWGIGTLFAFLLGFRFLFRKILQEVPNYCLLSESFPFVFDTGCCDFVQWIRVVGWKTTRMLQTVNACCLPFFFASISSNFPSSIALEFSSICGEQTTHETCWRKFKQTVREASGTPK